VNLEIEGNLVSKPYLDATISTMRHFGIKVQTLIPYKRYNIAPIKEIKIIKKKERLFLWPGLSQ